MVTSATKPHKDGYVIACSSVFRDEILALAERKHVNPGDLARSMILALPNDGIDAFPDPGDPDDNDRETVTLKSGTHSGKIWQRKPRIQVRLPAGYHMIFLRKALGVSLALEKGTLQAQLSGDNKKRVADKKEPENNEKTQNIENLHRTVDILAFQKLPHGCTQLDDALYIFGMPRRPMPDSDTLRRRYRDLASIFHPDSPIGNHERMSMINNAMSFLKSMKMI